MKAIDLFQTVVFEENAVVEFPTDFIQENSNSVAFKVPTYPIVSEEKTAREAERLLRVVAEDKGEKRSDGIIIECDGVKVCVTKQDSLVHPVQGNNHGFAILSPDSVYLAE